MINRVLIVEDDLPTQTLLHAVLSRHAIACVPAYDGKSAIEAIGREDFSAILLDLLLPRVDGFAVLREMKAGQSALLSRVIVMTAAAEVIWRGCAELDLVSCVLRKPLDIDVLLSHVRGCIDRREAPRMKSSSNFRSA